MVVACGVAHEPQQRSSGCLRVEQGCKLALPELAWPRVHPRETSRRPAEFAVAPIPAPIAPADAPPTPGRLEADRQPFYLRGRLEVLLDDLEDV
jgi:hypothetical protein